jgi:hypothetical protein
MTRFKFWGVWGVDRWNRREKMITMGEVEDIQ